MEKNIAELITEIEKLAPDWHDAGVVKPAVLRAIAELAEPLGGIRHSVETGCGLTTLLFSHLSAEHCVFAIDAGKSITQVRNSPLLKKESVTFIEAPSQLSLPNHKFLAQVQIALIDGPHGYPFPDMEYYYFYPWVERGGLLLVDDIQIPSIGRMFEIIKADAMFSLVKVVDNMAFFRRTDAPLIDPLSDSWWLQGYNLSHVEQLQKARSNSVLRRFSRRMPSPLKKLIPANVKRKIWAKI